MYFQRLYDILGLKAGVKEFEADDAGQALSVIWRRRTLCIHLEVLDSFALL